MHAFVVRGIAVSSVKTYPIVETSYIGRCLSNLAARIVVLRPPACVAVPRGIGRELSLDVTVQQLD